MKQNINAGYQGQPQLPQTETNPLTSYFSQDFLNLPPYWPGKPNPRPSPEEILGPFLPQRCPFPTGFPNPILPMPASTPTTVNPPPMQVPFPNQTGVSYLPAQADFKTLAHPALQASFASYASPAAAASTANARAGVAPRHNPETEHRVYRMHEELANNALNHSAETQQLSNQASFTGRFFTPVPVQKKTINCGEPSNQLTRR
ncbi:hypothetical protein [Legionella septentrionalis]|uniref:Uncharacterized protein n=1 Tax=Legionella septentrionalis TaxID=2498109 RepID=A0A3S0WS43_9GAMM|nr:hypothetical protein [Legionella septentrionalis]RUQ88855.1 hypothetical protein EKM59_04780 [Legionella septentrionalis]RUR02967.1 hypothetical protein ELY11_01015 [Legionella septentrionalis]RUR11566.1 hypothetical protein ELY14_02125 [Legionella septentrionalis]